jgi:hypothetical protein
VASLGAERGSQRQRKLVAARPNSAAQEEEERERQGREKVVWPGGLNQRRKHIRMMGP